MHTYTRTYTEEYLTDYIKIFNNEKIFTKNQHTTIKYIHSLPSPDRVGRVGVCCL